MYRPCQSVLHLHITRTRTGDACGIMLMFHSVCRRTHAQDGVAFNATVHLTGGGQGKLRGLNLLQCLDIIEYVCVDFDQLYTGRIANNLTNEAQKG